MKHCYNCYAKLHWYSRSLFCQTCKTKMGIKRIEECRKCHGTGKTIAWRHEETSNPWNPMRERGSLTPDSRGIRHVIVPDHWETCSRCGGSGRIIERENRANGSSTLVPNGVQSYIQAVQQSWRDASQCTAQANKSPCRQVSVKRQQDYVI